MKTVSSIIAAAALAASVAAPASADPVRMPDRPIQPVQTIQDSWRNDCYRNESQSECRRRLSYDNRRGGPYNGYGDNYGSGYSGGYSGGYDRDPRYYDRGGYYDQYVRPGNSGGYYGNGYGSSGGYYGNGYNSGGGYYGNGYGYGSGYANDGYYGGGYGSGGYYGGGYGSGGYGYGSGYNNQWNGVAMTVLGVALGVAILGSLDDRDHWDENRHDRRYGDYCRDRYRSFDWNSGTYLGNDGYRHYCRWN